MGLSLGKGFTFNARSLLIAARNDDGYPVGLAPDPSNPALNTVYGAYRLGLRELEHPEREVSKAFNREDGRIKQRAILGVTDDGEGTFEIGTIHEEVLAYLRGGGYDSTISDEMLFLAGNRGGINENTYFLMGGKLIQLDSGVLQYKYDVYHNTQIEQTTISPINQDDGENPQAVNFTFTPSVADRLITGQPFSTTDMTVYEDQDTFTEIRSTYELHQATWIANGSATNFTLPYRPLLSDATVGGGNVICKNGVPTAVTSVTTSTGVVVIAAAGSSGDVWTVLYPTRWQAI